MRQHGGGAAIVFPLAAGLGHERPLKHEAVAVRRHSHRALAVARIAIGERLVPFDAERHRQRVRDGQAAALRIPAQTVVGRKLVDQRLLEGRDLAVVDSDPIGQSDDALGYRAQVVFDVGIEGHRSERLAPALVRP